MLLFSTVLKINDTMGKDDFIKLVLEWNQGSPHKENVIRGIKWNGEHNIRYGDKDLWLDIEEYRNENIIAVRYEQIALDGVVWDTDYVMNFNDMKMSIRLDRSFLEEALIVESSFSTPHFITLLINHGYLQNDGDLPLLRKPIFIKENNISILTNIINGLTKYKFPIVYVSKNKYGYDPVNIWELSRRLKGVAHVLVQESPRLNGIIRQQCDDRNEHHGEIGIYFPTSGYGHVRYSYREYEGVNNSLAEKVVRSVIKYSIDQRVDMLYTWQGVKNALLMARLETRGAELLTAINEKNRAVAEADDLIDSVDDEIKKLQKQVADLTRANEIMAYENQGLRTKLNNSSAKPLIFAGEEDEFYQYEIKGIVLEALKLALDQWSFRARRRDILNDIIRCNECQNKSEDYSEKIKHLMKGYKCISGPMKRSLQEMGFVISEEGKHYKLTYYGDSRYLFTLAKTPSDIRTGKNIASEIIKDMF